MPSKNPPACTVGLPSGSDRMTWNEIFGVFTKPLFQLGQTWISLATIVEFVVVTAIVVLLSRLIRHFLRTRVLAHTKLDLGQQYALSRIVSYIVLVFGLLIGVETMRSEEHTSEL